jgi:hypothetical protein
MVRAYELRISEQITLKIESIHDQGCLKMNSVLNNYIIIQHKTNRAVAPALSQKIVLKAKVCKMPQPCPIEFVNQSLLISNILSFC